MARPVSKRAQIVVTLKPCVTKLGDLSNILDDLRRNILVEAVDVVEAPIDYRPPLARARPRTPAPILVRRRAR